MIVGHKKIIRRLSREAARGCADGSYIFSGPEKVRKRTVALDFAGKILKEKEAEKNSNFFSLRSGEEGGEIKIEETREFLRAMSFTGLGNGRRVFLIDGADNLNRQSQNALLKRLEEPRKGNVIILVVKDEKNILPTIASRCRRIRFSLVGNEEMEEILKIYPEDRKFLEFWSFGRPGRAIELAENKEKRESVREEFLEFKSLLGSDFGEKSRLADKISRDKEALEKRLEVWLIILRNSLLLEKNPVRLSPKKSFRLLEKMEETLTVLRNTHSNQRLLLENLFLEF